MDNNMRLYLSMSKDEMYKENDKNVMIWFAIVEDHKLETEYDKDYSGIIIYDLVHDSFDVYFLDGKRPDYGVSLGDHVREFVKSGNVIKTKEIS